jgi:hypothetical protein
MAATLGGNVDPRLQPRKNAGYNMTTRDSASDDSLSSMFSSARYIQPFSTRGGAEEGNRKNGLRMMPLVACDSEARATWACGE